MKAKTIIWVMGAAIAIQAGIIIYFIFHNEKSMFPLRQYNFVSTKGDLSNGGPSKKFDTKIRWDTVQTCTSIYSEHPDRLYLPVECGGGTPSTLHGFYVDKSTIDTIFNNSLADQIFVFFGVHPTDIDEDSYDDMSFSVFISGYDKDADSIITVNHNNGKSLIYDYLDPCPTKCPDNHPCRANSCKGCDK